MLILEKELSIQTDLAQRLRTNLNEERERTRELEGLLALKTSDNHDLLENLTRQANITATKYRAESEAYQQQLLKTQAELAALKSSSDLHSREYAKTLEDKTSQITDLTQKYGYLASEFQSLLNDSMTKLSRNLESAALEWKQNSATAIKAKEVQRKKLDDFYLGKSAPNC